MNLIRWSSPCRGDLHAGGAAAAAGPAAPGGARGRERAAPGLAGALLVRHARDGLRARHGACGRAVAAPGAAHAASGAHTHHAPPSTHAQGPCVCAGKLAAPTPCMPSCFEGYAIGMLFICAGGLLTVKRLSAETAPAS